MAIAALPLPLFPLAVVLVAFVASLLLALCLVACGRLRLARIAAGCVIASLGLGFLVELGYFAIYLAVWL